MRLPAREIESLVAAQIASVLCDPLALCARLATSLQPGCIDVAPHAIDIALRPAALLDLLGIAADPTTPMAPLTIAFAANLKRSGRPAHRARPASRNQRADPIRQSSKPCNAPPGGGRC